MNGLPVYAIYKHPDDAPDHFVVRVWRNDQHGTPMPGEAWYEDTYEKALGHIPPGLVKLAPDGFDVPCLKETWL